MRFFCVLSALVILVSCATTQKAAVQQSLPYFPMNVSRIDLQILDVPTRIDTGEITIPFDPFPGQNDIHHPQISNLIQENIKKKLDPYSGKGNRPVILQIEIKNALEGWDVGTAKKTEFAEINLNISIKDSQTSEVLVVGAGKSFKENTVVMIDRSSIRSLFETSFQDAVDRFFSQEENVRVLNENLKRIENNAVQTAPPVSAIPMTESVKADTAQKAIPKADSIKADTTQKAVPKAKPASKKGKN